MSSQSIQLPQSVRYQIAGESSVIVYFKGDEVGQLAHFYQWLKQQRLVRSSPLYAITEIIPSYLSILITFDPFAINHHSLIKILKRYKSVKINPDVTQVKRITLPVLYDPRYGIDLVDIARQARLDIDQVIALHQESTYTVQAIGFAPGFAYLGDLDPRIATPRLSTPRKRVPKGAVAIANTQTAVYPSESPGGWNVIGLCPINLFNPDATNPLLFEVGDQVKFEAIDELAFIELGGQLPEREGFLQRESV